MFCLIDFIHIFMLSAKNGTKSGQLLPPPPLTSSPYGDKVKLRIYSDRLYLTTAFYAARCD